jgi:hypothetical protein
LGKERKENKEEKWKGRKSKETKVRMKVKLRTVQHQQDNRSVTSHETRISELRFRS